MVAETGSRTAGWLLAVVGFLIIYGSLYPFHFAGIDADGPLDVLRKLPWARTTRSDIAANIVLYLPLGACLGWLLAGRRGAAFALVASLAAGALLSSTIEILQLFETRRVASLQDIAYNTLGTFLGAAFALVLRASGQRLRTPSLALVLSEPVAAALIVLWICARLAPFDFAADPVEWRDSLRPLLRGDWQALWPAARFAVLWLVAFEACRALAQRGPSLLLATLAIAAVLGGRVLMEDLQLLPAELVGIGAALLVGTLLDRIAPTRALDITAWLLAALIVAESLTPFTFRPAFDSIGFVPLDETLAHWRALGSRVVFERCFMAAALVWLLARAGRPVLVATLLGAGLLTAIELLQGWLPRGSAELGAPMVAFIAGGMIALFDGRNGMISGGLSGSGASARR